jgi:ABC-type phosphate transport system substrate-binding protein
VAAAACLAAILAAAPAFAQATTMAVIVHPDVQVDNLTLAELRRLLLGDREFWPSCTRVTILIRPPVAAERDAIVRDVCEMTEATFRKHWIGKVFRAETPSGPRLVGTTQAALDEVRRTPGAIAFVDAAAVDAGTKVLAIDGRRPGDRDYRFR